MSETKTTLRDKLWLFASPAHDDDIYFRSNSGRFSRRSRITPAEGAWMLDVPNMILVTSQGCPMPYSEDAYGYMESFCRMDKILWSVTGSGGFRVGSEEGFICELTKKYPNISGAFLDDMFADWGIETEEELRAREEKYIAQLAEIRSKLDASDKRLELWATTYTRALGKFTPKLYDALDGITIWNMDAKSVGDMEGDFERWENFLPSKRKMLGLYFYDYPRDCAYTDEQMEVQCELGRRLLKEGRVEGVIFLTNCVMGIGLSSEYWLRDWIRRVGDEVI